jgi:RsiW-degrading membrane proteinase PrsW (M82 family)
MIGGVAAAVLGSAIGVAAILIGTFSGADVGPGTTLPGVSLIALALGLGLPVAYQGWSARKGRATRAFSPGRIWWMGLALVLVIGLGAAVTSFGALDAILLPPLHVVAMALPPLILVAIAGRSVRGSSVTWRELVGSLGAGGIVATFLSLVVEAIVIVALVVAVMGVVWALPGGQDQLSQMLAELQTAAMLGDSDQLAELLLRPSVILAAFGIAGIAVPLVEELFKTLAVGLVGAWARPSPARAFMWGVASGAGFAIAENLLNGAVLGSEGWTTTAVTRIAATVMHCFTGGLVGWGWGELWSGRRAGRFLASLAGAVVLHAFWNSLAVGLTALQVAVAAGGVQAMQRWVGLVGALGGVGILGVLAVALAAAIPVIGRRLSSRAEQPDVEPPEAEAEARPEAEVVEHEAAADVSG